ncbi:MAG: tetratricopeptide repeat protein [Thiolinea sp.]
MKITVKYFRAELLCLTVSGGLVLSGCAPVPQAYPANVMQPQASVQQQYQYPATSVPQAAPLPQELPSARRYAALPSGRPETQEPSVPPTLQPAQQQRSNVVRKPLAINPGRPAVQQNKITRRPSTTNTGKRNTPPELSPAPQKKTSPSVRTEQKVAVNSSPRSGSGVVPAVTAMSKQQKADETEVLDMTRKTTTSKPVVEEKKAPPPPAPSYNGNPAVTILTKQANNQLIAGKTDRAASTLERALRIDPDNPMLWLRLAEVNEKQGNKAQASSMAKKAMILAPDDNNIKQRGRRLLD